VTRQQRKDRVRLTLAEFDSITQFACEECQMHYHPQGNNLYSIDQRTQLGNLTLPAAVSIFEGQSKANGMHLVPLRR